MIDLANLPPSVAELTGPDDDLVVTAPVNVTGTVIGGAMDYWSLEYRLDGADWVEFGRGEQEVVDGTIGRFDTTMLMNGMYEIRAVVTDLFGDRTLSLYNTVIVDGEMKVGQFTMSFEDMTLDLAGLPIKVMRTYDSRDKRPGDFGVGWRLSLSDVRVRKNTVIGEAWYQYRAGGFVPTFVLSSVRDRIVTITFSGGPMFRFRAVANPSQNLGALVGQTRIGWEALPGTNGRLAAVGDNLVLVTAASGQTGNLLGLDDVQVYNPSRFELTTPDGATYVVDELAGLVAVRDPYGRTLRFSAQGISHSSGAGVTFDRDPIGRIVRVAQRDLGEVRYGYLDAEGRDSGDLMTFTNRVGAVTRFTYYDRPAHHLKDVFDPTGARAARNEYDDQGRLVGQVDALGNRRAWENDLEGHSQVTVDRLGNRTRREFDDSGNIIREVDPLGGVTTHEFDPRGDEIATTDPLGHVVRRTFDVLGNELTFTRPDGTRTERVYNDQLNPTRIVDERGRESRFDYREGRLATLNDASGATLEFQYDDSGFATVQRAANGSRTELSRNERGHVLRRRLFATDGQVVEDIRWTRDLMGNALSESVTRTGPDGPEVLESLLTRDLLGNLVAAQYADGTEARWQYDAMGRRLIQSDRDGRTTRWAYDAVGNLIRVDGPGTSVQRFVYDAEGRMTESATDQGISRMDYDALGRQIRIERPDGVVEQRTYDAIGRPTAVATPGGTRRVTYDATCGCSRATEQEDETGRITQRRYDPQGRLTVAEDGTGERDTLEYDSTGQAAALTRDGRRWVVERNAGGRMTAATDPAGNQWRYNYSGHERVTEVVDPIGGTTEYAWDEMQNMVAMTDALGRITHYEYDFANNLSARILPSGAREEFSASSHRSFAGMFTGVEVDEAGRVVRRVPDLRSVEPAVSFEYDASGRRTSMRDAHGLTRYEYDAGGRVIRISAPHGVLNYAYDGAGHLRRLWSDRADGVDTTYEYDGAGRLLQVEERGGLAASYAYDAAGHVAGSTLGNGVAWTHRPSADGTFGDVSVRDVGGRVLLEEHYTLDPTGRTASVVSSEGGRVGYGFDGSGRLVNETREGPGLRTGRIDYTLDPVGNRLGRRSSIAGVPSVDLRYNDDNQVLTHRYDAGGNTTSVEGRNYRYNTAGRLIAADAVEFLYDGDGRLIGRREGQTTTWYLLDDRNPTGFSQVVEERVEVGGVVRSTRRFTFGRQIVGLGISDPGARFAVVDSLGSVRLLTDANGSVTDRYEYDAFGILLHSEGATVNPFLYRGERYEPAAGAYSLRSRFYRPELGRFLTPDEFMGDLQTPSSFHRYLYASADPISLMDPSGRMSLVSFAAAGSIMGTLAMIALPVPFGAVMHKKSGASYGTNWIFRWCGDHCFSSMGNTPGVKYYQWLIFYGHEFIITRSDGRQRDTDLTRGKGLIDFAGTESAESYLSAGGYVTWCRPVVGPSSDCRSFTKCLQKAYAEDSNQAYKLNPFSSTDNGMTCQEWAAYAIKKCEGWSAMSGWGGYW